MRIGGDEESRKRRGGEEEEDEEEERRRGVPWRGELLILGTAVVQACVGRLPRLARAVLEHEVGYYTPPYPTVPCPTIMVVPCPT